MAWQDRTALGGAPSNTDTLLINDRSDTTDDAAGTVKRLKVAELAAAEITSVTGTSHTIGLDETVILASNAATQTITVPLNSTTAIPVGTLIQVIRAGVGPVVMAAAGGVTINTSRGLTITEENGMGWLRKTGTDEWTFNSRSPFAIVTTNSTDTTYVIGSADAGSWQHFTGSGTSTINFDAADLLPANAEITLSAGGSGTYNVGRTASGITFNGQTGFELKGTAVVKRLGSSTDYLVEGETDEDAVFYGGVEFQGQISEAYNTIAASGAATIDLSIGSVFATTLTGNITSMTITNEPASGVAASFVLKVVNDGSSTITWDTAIDWPGGTAPTLSGTNGDVDWFSFITHDGGTTWFGNIVGQDYS